MLRPCLVALVLLGTAPSAAGAQDWLLLGGLADLEGWSTDSGSTLLTRNDGDPAGLVRLYLWAGVDLRSRVQLLALTESQAGPATGEDPEVYLQQLGIRFIASRALVVETGRFPNPVGAFANRRLSNSNPLIGTPDAYPVAYPWGAKVSGVVGRFDYRAALISLPMSHEGYVPDPSPAPHPALGGGFTPIVGLRIGASATEGPYLNRSLPPALLAGRAWDDYHQRVLAFDAAFSRGYAEFRAELGLSAHEVPGGPNVAGLAFYGEVKYTFTPRLFVASRLEQNDYPFVGSFDQLTWVARRTKMYNGEVGVGYRLARGALAKMSFRKDRWAVEPALRPILPDGYALAAQLSYTFDLAALLPWP